MKRAKPQKSITMRGQPAFDWQLDDRSTRQTATTLASIQPPQARRRWGVLVACLIVFVGVGFWVGQRLLNNAEANLAAVEAEVASALALEQSARADMPSATTGPTNAAAHGQFGDNVTLLELSGDLALVDVIVSDAPEVWYSAPYRVARILRHENGVWRAIAPVNNFWAERRTRETAYFRLDYGRRDQAAVDEVAPLLDEIYLRLHADLGLPTPITTNRITLLISVVEGSEVRVTDVRYSGRTLIIPPPELVPHPPTMSTGETLRQAITFPLAVKTFEAAQKQHEAPCNWRAVNEGVGLWLRWEGHTLPSRRQWETKRVVQEWLNPAALPRLDDLLSVPRDCWQPPPFLEMEVLNSGRPMPRSELAATLIEALVASYGRQAVPLLLAQLSNYPDWESVNHQALQRTVEEVESAWHEYLLAEIR